MFVASKGKQIQFMVPEMSGLRRWRQVEDWRKANATHIPAANYVCGVLYLTVQHLRSRSEVRGTVFFQKKLTHHFSCAKRSI